MKNKIKISKDLKDKFAKILVVVITIIIIIGMFEIWAVKNFNIDIEESAKEVLGIENEENKNKATTELVNKNYNEQTKISAKDGKIKVLDTSKSWIMYNNKIYQLCSGSYYESKDDQSDINKIGKIKRYDSNLKTGELGYEELLSNTEKKETTLYQIKDNNNYLLSKIEDENAKNQYVIYMDQSPEYNNFKDMLQNKEHIISSTYVKYTSSEKLNVKRENINIVDVASLDENRVLSTNDISDPTNTITGYMFVKMDNNIVTTFIMQETVDENTKKDVVRLLDMYDSKVYVLDIEKDK